MLISARFTTIIYWVFFTFILLHSKVQSQSLSDLSFGTESTFDAITWNIEWFPKHNRTDDSVSQIIESLQADVIAVQEIDDTTLFRQTINGLPDYELLIQAQRFNGLAYVYNTNTVTIQSFYSIFNTPPYYNVFPRSPIVLELTYEGENFIIINNHFKCCGNGVLEPGDTSDEEFRRYEASSFLKHYVDINFPNDRVLIVGDLNDILTDDVDNNVFQMFLDDSTQYQFADMDIAEGPTAYWSYPNWPSHLDHILMTNENFADLNKSGSEVVTIRVDDYMQGGFSTYDYYVSDHRPVGIKLQTGIPLGQEEIHPQPFKMYPNPTSGFFQIEWASTTTSTHVQITDLKGRTIHSEAIQSNVFQWNMAVPKGCYLVHIYSDEGVVVNKLVKQ